MVEEVRYFVFKANVPLEDDSLMLDWTKSCQAKVPEGHGDYRWGKMAHDHLFVKNFKDLIESLVEEVKSLRAELSELKEKDNGGLFK